MAIVRLWSSARSALDGADQVEIKARNVRVMLRKLSEQYPALRPQIESGVTISVDGEITNEAGFTPIDDDSEVFLLPRIGGG